MKDSSLLRFFMIGLLISLGLGFASFFGLRMLNESSMSEIRRHMVLFTAQIIESAPYAESIQDHHFHGGHRGEHFFGSDMWIISQQGEILASNTPRPLPISWEKVKKPLNVHEFTFLYYSFKLVSDLTLIKLNSPTGDFLLMGSKKPQPWSGPFFVQTSFFILVIGFGFLIAFFLITFYLKQKSLEARTVLARLEKGDLKARFEIKRLDEIGSLMFDFNKMASEIERLVNQVQQTESARKDLLQELSHDIRTPLTSLKTAIETLSEHADEMSKEQQKEFLKVSHSELNYFLHLVEDLFFIADLGEPRYKKTTEEIDLLGLISEEIKTRSSAIQKEPKVFVGWKEGSSTQSLKILGDPILIQRLLKNSIDNGCKFAKNRVTIEVQKSEGFNNILIEDDGLGITDEAIDQFGKRKTQRLHFQGKSAISLGLGSVILKTIVELHGGSLKIERISQGTRLTLNLPG